MTTTSTGSPQLAWSRIWAGFLGLVALAAYLLAVGLGPARPDVIAVVNVACFVPLVGLALAAARRAQRLRTLGEVNGEWLRVNGTQRDLLPARAREIRAARVEALQRPEQCPIPAVEAPPGLLADLVTEACRRYVAGEMVSLTSLRAFAHDRLLDRLECFVGLAHRALVVGFIGTLVGIILQVVLAQRTGTAGLLEATFLNGTLLAMTTTLLGILTAGYVHWLRGALLERAEIQVDEALSLLAVGLLPGLGDENTRVASEVAEILGRATRDMERRFVELSGNLGRAVATALEGVQTAVATAVVAALEDHLGQTVTKALGDLGTAVTTAVSGLQQSVGASNRVLIAAGASLGRAAGAIQVELATAIRTPGELTRTLQGSLNDLSRVADAFTQITSELKEAGAVLCRSDDEVLARAHVHERAAEQMLRQTEAGRDHLNHAARTFGESVEHLSVVVQRLVEAHIARIDDVTGSSPSGRRPAALVPGGFFDRFRSTRSDSSNGRR